MTEETKQTPQIDLPPINDLSLETIQNYDYSGVTEFVVEHSLNVLSALAVFVIGRFVAKRIIRLLDRAFDKAGVERTLGDFLENIFYGIFMAVVVIAALGQMGVETTSFAAIIAAAGLAVGLALQGSLSNFAAGVLIILFKPFKAGDYVEVAGTGGTIEEISIFTTRLATPDNRTIIIPNNNITVDTIVNYTAKSTRRMDLVVGVAYDADLKKARKVFEKVIAAEDRFLKNPEPVIAVMDLNASSVDFIVRPWVKSSDYWNVRFEVMESIKTELDKAGIGIPFPQRDINLFIKEGALPGKK